MFDRLRAHFSDAQIVELTWRIAFCGAINRFSDILQVEVEAGSKEQEAAE
jgi:alkylhydroperoxidase family enzyme